jgi:hypothetical protein
LYLWIPLCQWKDFRNINRRVYCSKLRVIYIYNFGMSLLGVTQWASLYSASHACFEVSPHIASSEWCNHMSGVLRLSLQTENCQKDGLPLIGVNLR